MHGNLPPHVCAVLEKGTVGRPFLRRRLGQPTRSVVFYVTPLFVCADSTPWEARQGTALRRQARLERWWGEEAYTWRPITGSLSRRDGSGRRCGRYEAQTDVLFQRVCRVRALFVWLDIYCLCAFAVSLQVDLRNVIYKGGAPSMSYSRKRCSRPLSGSRIYTSALPL